MQCIWEESQGGNMSIFDINREFPVGNAAGWCKTVVEVVNLAASAAQFIVVGSFTVLQRDGNSGNTFNGESLNSLGLPNGGVPYLRECGARMVKLAHDARKQIILSIAGFEPNDFYILAQIARELGFDGIEVNVGCPNLVQGAVRKPIISFIPDLVREIVNEVVRIAKSDNGTMFVLVKMSPMSNPTNIVDLAYILAKTGVDAVVTQNTFPNALLFNDDGTLQIQTPDKTGWAGFAGSAIKPMALGQVNQWRKALDSQNAGRIQVWGVGGVQSGRDVHDMLRAGASVVQVGTAYFVSGAKIFGEIANQF
jgi:dihydroorotate dehydrogenase (fumarate)